MSASFKIRKRDVVLKTGFTIQVEFFLGNTDVRFLIFQLATYTQTYGSSFLHSLHSRLGYFRLNLVFVSYYPTCSTGSV